MEKVKLEIEGLSHSQTQSGAYALVLTEAEGNRRLPIIIGGFEAQSIAIELENMTPTRPLTHDLFKNFAIAHDISVQEIIIYNLAEGIFYSKLICVSNGKTIEVDARTSDAIAIGVRFKCPVYTYEKILDSAGIDLNEAQEGNPETAKIEGNESDPKQSKDDVKKMTVDELEKRLNQAIENENYELASKLRDEINRRTS